MRADLRPRRLELGKAVRGPVAAVLGREVAPVERPGEEDIRTRPQVPAGVVVVEP